MRSRAVLLAAGILVLAPPSGAADPGAWLVQVSDAARASTYQGVVVFRDSNSMEVLRFAHRQRNGRVEERLTSLTGKPRDLVRAGDDVACLTAGEAPATAGGIPQSLFPVMSPELLARASAHYDVRDAGDARVAGRACRAVAMAPRDEYRYGYEVCADTETAVPLRVTLLDSNGRAVEQLMFTEVSFPKTIADSTFALPAGTPKRPAVASSAMAASAGPSAWQLAKLPPGYRVILRSRSEVDGVEHVLLSDGVSAVSVFGARTAPDAQPVSGLAQMGAMNAYARRLGAMHLTVVGEVPPATVRLIGDGLTAGDVTD